MANDIDKTSPHYKGDFGSIYEVNQKFPTGGVAGDFVVIEGWAHYWNADRATWCVNAERDSYWDELITNIIEKFKLVKGATYMGVASLDTVPAKAIGAKMYYFATVAGTYKNFGDLVVPQGINVLYSENGSSWVNTTLLEVAQELGVSTKKVVSQKALNDALNLKANQSSVNEALAKKADKEEMNRLLGTKANVADVNTKFTEEKTRVDAELAKKFDKSSIAQETGEAEDKVMSQKALSDKLSDLSDKVSIKDEEGTVVETPFRYIQNEEFIYAVVDAEDRLLFGIRWDGTPVFGKTSAEEESILSNLNNLSTKLGEDIKDLQDTKVNKEEGKSLIEDEVKKCFKVIQNEEFIYAVVDAEDRLLFGIYRDSGKPYFPLNEMYHVEQNEEFFAVWLDSDNHILLGIRRDGSVIQYNPDVELLKKQVSGIENNLNKLTKVNVVDRNIDRIPALMSACRYKGGKQDFQLCIITDSHAEELSVKNAVTLCNNISVIDAIIHCGDITAYTYDKAQANTFFNDYSKCIKPWLIVIGNHDVGNTMYVHNGATHDEAYESFIKPMVTNNILREGEYQVGKSYYYHDFPSRKVRVIVIYDYDNPLDIADNDYWDMIEYDSSIPKLIPGNKYTVGDKINCGGFVGKSFVCKKEVKTIDNSYDTTYTMPYYKVGRAVVCIGKEQAQWLVSTLKNTPSEYGIIIATHSPAMLNSTNQTQYNFAIDTPKTGKGEGMNAMSTDLLPEIMDAFINKSTKQIHVKMKSGDWHKADASYLNTIIDSNGEKYAYDLDVDFTDRNDCYFAGYVGGHVHDDLIYKHDSYKGQYSVNPVCAITEQANRRHADIIDVRKDSLCYDALTCFSCSKGRIALSRLGNTLSINGKHRDIEIISTNI